MTKHQTDRFFRDISIGLLGITLIKCLGTMKAPSLLFDSTTVEIAGMVWGWLLAWNLTVALCEHSMAWGTLWLIVGTIHVYDIHHNPQAMFNVAIAGTTALFAQIAYWHLHKRQLAVV